MSQDTADANGSDRIHVDLKEVQEWIANCAPNLPVGPDDERYLDFGAYEEELRGKDHIRSLYDTVTLSGSQSCQLFSGFNGTGKSTELRRLKHSLEAADYTVLLVDANDYHDLGHALTFEDLLVAATGAFGEATTALLGKDVFKESYWDRLKNLLASRLGVEELKLKLGPAGEVKVGVRHAVPFWVELREEVLAKSRSHLTESCHQFVRECVARIRKDKRHQHTRGVVFIFDSLEKLKGTIFQFQEMMESIIQAFSRNPEYLHLPDCHVVYSIPPYVQIVRPELVGYYSKGTLLPAVKVLEKGPDIVAHPPGVKAMSALVGRRFPLDQVFGNRRDLLERLVIYSGGHVRTLVRFVRQLLLETAYKGFPPDEQDIEAILQQFREQATVWPESVGFLEKIRLTGSIRRVTREEYPFLAEYMDTYVVLCYRNGGGWYEIHPLVRDDVTALAEELAAEQRQKRLAERSQQDETPDE
jgi:hypothetical protein